MRVHACRNRHSILFGLGWPSIALGTQKQVYIYAGLWLVTVTSGRA